MEHKLDDGHPLWSELIAQNPLWWQNLKSDPDITCDIRKDNYLNFYHNGGSLMRLHWDGGFRAEIHHKYVPLQVDHPYLPFVFEGGEARLASSGIMDIENFAREPLERVKKRIRKYYPNHSEKGLQGRYVVNALQAKKGGGYFIDTEFEYQGKRMDMVWVEPDRKTIAFVELKRTADAGLVFEAGQDTPSVADQLARYASFIQKNREDLLAYYDRVYRIKKRLGLLKGFSRFRTLQHFRVLGKPILLIGDASKAWIEDNAERINARVAPHAFGCVYHGPHTFRFRIPFETAGHQYRLEGASRASEYSMPAGLRSRKSLQDIYPELAKGAKVPAGPLGTIKRMFAESFLSWGIFLPEEDVVLRRRGKICQGGWAIWYLFGVDEVGEYLDYYSAHRMTDDGHFRIYEDGQCLSLPAIPGMRPGSRDPEEDARLKEKYKEKARRALAILEAKGFGMDGDEPGGVQIQRVQKLEE